MKKSKLFILLILFPFYIFANDIEINVIIENCKSCHGQNYEGNNYIKSLKTLEKEEFISKMIKYANSNNDHVMSRISKVLNKKDILKMADEIYEKIE
ncbi:MAG: c-type cytochrome [Alphaproteobacteria bacterium]|tara:strand:+ start:482 stop:772 length:291 start_codon:yes stop_codon:yes gene_type:complete